MHRVNAWNCVWLCWPHITILELAETFTKNMHIIEASELINKDRLQLIINSLVSFTSATVSFGRHHTDVPTTNNQQ